MSANTPKLGHSLEAASRQVRELCRAGEPLPPWIDRGSVGRILVHLDNIKRSVVASTHDHRNAAKRLKDFALVFTRLAQRPGEPDEAIAARLTSVADNLRAASQCLASGDAVPDRAAAGAEAG